MEDLIMKHTLKFSIAPILFALVCSLSLSAATTPGHNNPPANKAKKATITHQQVMVKENKFTSVTFGFSGGSKTDPDNWTSGNPGCSGGTVLCSITFDDSRYTLVDDKPNSTVLDIVNRLADSTADGQEIIDGTTHTGIFVHKKAS